MANNEILTLRMNILGSMDTYIREVIGDDEITEHWDRYGIPDGADEVDYMEMAEDEGLWKYLCEMFGLLVSKGLVV